MSQPAYIFPGSPLAGTTFMTDLSAMIAGILSLTSGSTTPTQGPGAAGALVVGQLWLNTTVNPNILNMWDGTAWVQVGSLDTSNHAFAPGITGNAWSTYTPAISFSSGSGLTTSSLFGKYKQVGKLTFVNISITVNAVGTAAGSLFVTLPFASATANDFSSFSGADISTSNALSVWLTGTAATLTINKYDGTSPIAAHSYAINGVYETP